MVDTSLFDMKVAGSRELPTAAKAYSQVTEKLNPADNESDAFDPEFYDVAPAWKNLRDEVQTLCADASDYLNRVGNALVVMAEDFASQDQGAADDLRHLEDTRTEDDVKPEVPAPHRPENRDLDESDRDQDRDRQLWEDPDRHDADTSEDKPPPANGMY